MNFCCLLNRSCSPSNSLVERRDNAVAKLPVVAVDGEEGLPAVTTKDIVFLLGERHTDCSALLEAYRFRKSVARTLGKVKARVIKDFLEEDAVIAAAVTAALTPKPEPTPAPTLASSSVSVKVESKGERSVSKKRDRDWVEEEDGGRGGGVGGTDGKNKGTARTARATDWEEGDGSEQTTPPPPGQHEAQPKGGNNRSNNLPGDRSRANGLPISKSASATAGSKSSNGVAAKNSRKVADVDRDFSPEEAELRT